MRAWIAVLVLAACAGDSPPSQPSNKCAGNLYEPCIEEHECDSNVCQLFADDGFQVCSQVCDAATPCPDGGTCDVNGNCKPAAPDLCDP